MGSTSRQLLAQVAAIRKLNRKFDRFRLFAGVECDIFRDGTLDFPDKVLRSSITSSFRCTPFLV